MTALHSSKSPLRTSSCGATCPGAAAPRPRSHARARPATSGSPAARRRPPAGVADMPHLVDVRELAVGSSRYTCTVFGPASAGSTVTVVVYGPDLSLAGDRPGRRPPPAPLPAAPRRARWSPRRRRAGARARPRSARANARLPPGAGEPPLEGGAPRRGCCTRRARPVARGARPSRARAARRSCSRVHPESGLRDNRSRDRLPRARPPTRPRAVENRGTAVRASDQRSPPASTSKSARNARPPAQTPAGEDVHRVAQDPERTLEPGVSRRAPA